MVFSTYLNESKSLNNEATLVIHKIMHMIDNAHVDYSDAGIRFSVGAVIHKGAYNGLQVVFRSGKTSAVRLGKDSRGKPTIVIDVVGDLPERKKIDTYLGKTEIFNAFVQEFTKYLKVLHDHAGEHSKYDHEVGSENTENFELNYNALISAFTDKNIAEYKKVVKSIEDGIVGMADMTKREAYTLSVKKLQKDYLGTTEAEFLATIKKLEEYKKFDNIDKELSGKLESRLKTYYHSTVTHLTSK
jgi:hypothetical protein